MQIIEDLPIKDINKDLLNRENLVDLVTNSIIDSSKKDHDSFCIGIYAKWGYGKTSFMNFIKEKLVKYNNKLSVIEFNPWIAKDQDTLLIDFFDTISEVASPELDNVLKRYRNKIFAGAGTISKILSKIVEGDKVYKTTLKYIGNICAGIPEIIDNKTLAGYKKEISDNIIESKKHFVVFIDDIDRLDNQETHEVLRLVRQVADFKNVIYIIAMDPEIVANSLNGYFGNGTTAEGREFLEKIIQVPIQLPVTPMLKMHKIIKQKIMDLWKSNACGNEEELDAVCEQLSEFITTQRQIVRLINQLNFLLPTLKGEVDMKNLFVLIGIKTIDNQAYIRIYQNRNALFKNEDLVNSIIDVEEEKKQVKRKYETALDDIVKDIKSPIKNNIRNIIDSYFSHQVYNGINDKSISNFRCFVKYFLFDVPEGIVPDRVCNEIQKKMAAKSDYDVSIWIKEIYENYELDELFRSILNVIELDKNNLEQRCAFSERFIQGIIEYKLCNRHLGEERILVKISLFIGEYIIIENMISKINDDGNHEYNNAKISNLLDYLYSNTPILFGIIFHYYDRKHFDFITDKSYRMALIKRINYMPYEELKEIKSVELIEVFRSWHELDKEGPENYLDKNLKSKNFDAKDFINKMIYQKGNQLVFDFIEIFGKSSVSISKVLEYKGETEESCPAMSSILGDYEKISNLKEEN